MLVEVFFEGDDRCSAVWQSNRFLLMLPCHHLWRRKARYGSADYVSRHTRLTFAGICFLMSIAAGPDRDERAAKDTKALHGLNEAIARIKGTLLGWTQFCKQIAVDPDTALRAFKLEPAKWLEILSRCHDCESIEPDQQLAEQMHRGLIHVWEQLPV